MGKWCDMSDGHATHGRDKDDSAVQSHQTDDEMSVGEHIYEARDHIRVAQHAVDEQWRSILLNSARHLMLEAAYGVDKDD
jgi:hypothetical protein